jgi:hypothetical protein
MEGAFTRQMQESAAVRNYKTEMDGILEPFRADWKTQGITDTVALKQLLDGFDLSNKDPVKFIEWIADMRGVDLRKRYGSAPAPRQSAAVGDDVPELHPVIKQRFDDMQAVIDRQQQQLGQVAPRIQQFEQSAQQQARERSQIESQAAHRAVDEFSAATDDAGHPKYPFFQELRGDMQRLLVGNAADSLEQAYDIAAHANPSVRAKILENRDIEIRRSIETKQREDARRARAAAGGLAATGPAVSGSESAPSAPAGSVREALEHAMAARTRSPGRI